MASFLKEINIQISFFIILVGIVILLSWTSEEEKTTRALLNTWAEKLDRNVKPSGVYIKWESDTLPENDAWGTPLKVDYKNEAVAEKLTVSSAGEDKQWNTDDDLRISKIQINAAGIGEGIKEHTAEVAKEATKGVAEGIKEQTALAAASAKDGLKDATSSAKEKAIGFMQNVKGKLSKEEGEQQDQGMQ